jgi:hypothetical protein
VLRRLGRSLHHGASMTDIQHIIDLMEREGVRKVEYYVNGLYSVIYTDGSILVERSPNAAPSEQVAA